MSRAEEIRADLQHLLQESDIDRPLDSLERTVVLAYLVGQGVTEDHTAPGRASTIREWMTWADRVSSGSSARRGMVASPE